MTTSKRNYYKYPERSNCGGYALGLEEWYKPYIGSDVFRERAIKQRLREGKTIEEIEKEILEQDTKFILQDFGRALSTTENPHTIPNSKKVIAYRICVDENFEGIYTDYHFKVRTNGVWSHKQGSMKPEECELDEDKPWGLLENDDETILHYYDSPIVYFVVEEEI